MSTVFPDEVRPSNGTPARFCASFNTLSLVFNVAFALNLATTPLMAYVSEPFPWAIPLQNTYTNVSFAEFNDAATTMFQSLFNNESMAPEEWCKPQMEALSFATRRTVTIPPAADFETRPFRQLNALVAFPGAAFYGAGQRQLVYDFLLANDTARTSARWRSCQYAVLLGIRVADGCVWIEAPLEPHLPTQYTAYYAAQFFEYELACWIKLAYRVGLAAYVVWLLWSKYYRHVHALYTELNTSGLTGSDCTRFEILVGDPSGLVLSSFAVALVVVVDIWINATYLVISTVQVSQTTDVGMFLLGCMYTVRFVWGGVLFMCIFTVAIKRMQWEDQFTPVDPAVMTAATYIYGGPLVAVYSATPAMALVHDLRNACLPADQNLIDTEFTAAIVAVSYMISSIPVMFSLAYTRIRKRRRRRQIARASTGSISTPTTSPLGRHDSWWNVHRVAYNDLKHRLLFARAGRYLVNDCRGGSIYKLFFKDPRYRTTPLTSLLAADVFVFCASRPHGPYDQQVRLTLLSLLDRRVNDAKLAISTCPKDHQQTVCKLGGADTCTESGAMTCVHRGATDWLM